MNIKKSYKNSFNKLIERACKGTNVSPRQLHKEFISYGYKNFKDLDLTLEEMRTIVMDIADSMENSTTHIQTGSSRIDIENQY